MDQTFEASYWGDCTNTFDEEQKHYVYARLMGIPQLHFSFDAAGASVLDIGGGPVSMLLKTVNLKAGRVCDPLPYPEWTRARYAAKNIDVIMQGGEDIHEEGWDEVWMYNCLQHTTDPRLIIENAKRAAKLIRIFEWVDIPAHDGHPHELTKPFLDECLGSPGIVTILAERGCFGRAYSHILTV